MSSHSAMNGRAATLYPNGIRPIDIQLWGSWAPPVYMRYVRRGNGRLRTPIYAIAKKTDLIDHMLDPEQKKRNVSFGTDYRRGGNSGADKLTVVK